MKQIYYSIITIFLLCNQTNLKAQTVVEFSYNITTNIASNSSYTGLGNAGVSFINNQFWVAVWSSNDIHLLDNLGNYLSTFQVPGISGTRSLTSDGNYIYCGTASNQIFKVDPITKTLVSTITITTTSNAASRLCAYDASLNGGMGGFWIANFNTDITSLDMNGNQLSVIPYATHGLTGMYGGAVDGFGNLYVYQQAGTNNDQISILNLSTQTVTGTPYNIFTNVCSSLGATSSLAGGLFFSDAIVSGKRIAIGVSQASPNNVLFGIDFNISLSTNNYALNDKISLYPNPSTSFIEFSGLTKTENYTIYNAIGIEIKKGTVSENSKIEIQNLANGIYFLKMKNGSTHKFIKE